jgi:hypothetical protein
VTTNKGEDLSRNGSGVFNDEITSTGTIGNMVLRIKGPPPVVVLNDKREFKTCFTTLSSSGMSSGGLFCKYLDSPIKLERRDTNESLSKLPNVSNKFVVVAIEFQNSSSSVLLQLLQT